ncbi:MAG: porin [Cognatishimia sp.]|uniref:porin n=1 Tax=Cognatishimia sp. 1_MG-2023 TaxID=3062642 RepID=UPI0026E2CD61|nr:porin [Cognatishimia sp. 1_MG-2023]MDO6728140.1 porin [Cognatishimia sp. 1_MG-2023]
MKNVLLASTALVLTAGIASADIAVTGEANMGLKYNGTTTTVHNEIDFNIVGTGETDGGVAFGASVDLDASSDNSANNAAGATSDIADPEVFVSYNGLKLTVGDIGEANDRGGVADLGYDGIGVDNVAEINAYGSHDVRVDYAFGDIAVAASVDSSNNDWAIGASASFDAFSVDLGYGETAGAEQVNLTLGYSAGAFGAKVFYADNATADSLGLEGSYTTGDVTVTAVYAESGASEGYGIGVAYDLGGATLAGGIGEVNNTTVADLGISFSF